MKKTPSQKLKLGIPKGSLQEYTIRVFREAGFNIEIPERRYFLKIDDPEIDCFLLRPQEVPKYIEKGKLDVGITGDDCILETKAKIVEVCDLRYAKQNIKETKWVLAVPEGGDIKAIKDLEGKTISTEMVNIVKGYLKKNKIKAKVEFSFGCTEVKPPRFADAIVDITETGVSLKAHNLKILDIVLESSTKLVANKNTWKDGWKKEKIKDLALLLQGAVRGEENTNLMLHIPKQKLPGLLKFLPKLKKPTIRKVAEKNWCSVSLSCNKKETRFLIPRLKRFGCKDIVQYPAIKLVP